MHDPAGPGLRRNHADTRKTFIVTSCLLCERLARDGVNDKERDFVSLIGKPRIQLQFEYGRSCGAHFLLGACSGGCVHDKKSSSPDPKKRPASS